jgi:hypothetical protein
MFWIQEYAASSTAFLWTVPPNSGIPARISSGDSQHTKQKCQPIGPDFRFETFQGQWLTHAVSPWIYLFMAKGALDVRDCHVERIKKKILQCVTLQQKHSSCTTVITSLCEVWCSQGDNYEHCCVLGLNVGRIEDGHATNIPRELVATDSSESLVPRDQLSA